MSGIVHIIEMINSKTAEKEKEIINEAERHKRLKLEEAQRRAKDTSDTITKKAELQAKAELSKYEASAKLKSKYQLLEAKDSLINDVLLKVQEHMQNIVTKAEYKKILANLIIDGCSSLEENKLELVFPTSHASKIELSEIEKEVAKKIDRKVSLSVSKDMIRSKGGVIIRTLDGTKWIDNTFEARLERLKNTVRDTISRILFADEK